MTDTCVIDRPTGSYNWNPQAGHDEPTTERVYEGMCASVCCTVYVCPPFVWSDPYIVC